MGDTSLGSYTGRSGDYVSDMVSDGVGGVWFGTRRSGIVHFDGVVRTDGLVFQSLTQRDGLVSNAVQSVWEDVNGDMWIATDGGASRYTPSSVAPNVRIREVIADRPFGPVAELTFPSSQKLFEVCAVDRDLNYSTPVSVKLIVHPPYGQIALQAGLALALVGLLVAGVRTTRRRRERDQARSELIAERRQRIEVQSHDIERWTIDDFAGTSAALQSVLSRIRELQQQDSQTLINDGPIRPENLNFGA